MSKKKPVQKSENELFVVGRKDDEKNFLFLDCDGSEYDVKMIPNRDHAIDFAKSNLEELEEVIGDGEECSYTVYKLVPVTVVKQSRRLEVIDLSHAPKTK